MQEPMMNQGAEDPLQDVKALVANWMKYLNDMQQELVENEQLRQRVAVLENEVEQQRKMWHEEKELRTKLEMQLNEMTKLSASVAGKASQEELLKALRVFVNRSKRKKLEKRTLVKEMILELVVTNGIVLPEDLTTTLDSLDDEQLVEQPQVTAGGVTENLAELLTAEAQLLWQRLRDAGFIVHDGYALAEGVSANQAAYIATAMAEKLQIKKKWKLFQQLWGIPNMAQLAGSWQQTGKLPPRSQEIDQLMQ
jgi:predicted RNase H-like nuclease (RuvC/YqgF family)